MMEVKFLEIIEKDDQGGAVHPTCDLTLEDSHGNLFGLFRLSKFLQLGDQIKVECTIGKNIGRTIIKNNSGYHVMDEDKNKRHVITVHKLYIKKAGKFESVWKEQE